MRAVHIREPGGSEVLKPGEAENPVAGAGELLIAVRIAGVNRPDAVQCSGRYPVSADAKPLPRLKIVGAFAEVCAGSAGRCFGPCLRTDRG